MEGRFFGAPITKLETFWNKDKEENEIYRRKNWVWYDTGVL